ncbi:hypothetical protein BMS3Abin03_00557 [bacterium BMS3Abin03]|nr:hypothetical protein BMS3Abin03_00557 [bacterium BMS3Abin03]
MNFLADENIDRQIVETLRDQGNNVIYIPEINPGINDEKVLEIAKENKAILITSDKDFGELVFRRKLISTGVILIRLHGYSTKRKQIIISDFLSNHSSEIENSFSVITKDNIRIRYRID